MRSVEELRRVSGYADRPSDFADLIRMLDGELRLITPVDPEGSVDAASPAQGLGGCHFQLTHDYLVHAAAGLAQPQAPRDAAGPGGAVADRAGVGLGRQARGPLPALAARVGEHPAIDPPRGVE